MLSVQQLEAGYGESVVLRGVNLEVETGQVVCLLGRNGVGKTTLMKSVIGLLKAKNGSISFSGHNITKLSPGARAKSGIGYVPQGREIFGQLTVHENLLLGLEACKVKTREIPASVYETFPVLKEMLWRRGGDLSGGQQQQLAIARALVSNPEVLLLDEPTEGIQPSVVDEIRGIIQSIKARGTTAILLVEQSLDFVKQVADYVYILEKGAVAAQGDADSLQDSDIHKLLTV